MNPAPALLAVDLGTGSVRVAAFAPDGQQLAYYARGLTLYNPAPGHFEQDPEQWWQETARLLGRVMADLSGVRPVALSVCGQMHAVLPLDQAGTLLLPRVPLWNDKRCTAQVRAFSRHPQASQLEALAANPATAAWSGFRISWLRRYHPKLYERTATFLTPKDYLNFRLTGVRASDYSEGSGSFLMEAAGLNYHPRLLEALGVERDKLPPLYPSWQTIGWVTAAAAEETGLPRGLPVTAGGGDFPVALLGMGVIGAGVLADLTGTSANTAVVTAQPVRRGDISNIHTATGQWAPCVVLEAGGDCLHWARRALAASRLEFADFIHLAETVPPGAQRLLFLPYLSGQRLGPPVRAQFFGITHAHGPGHFYRAVLEGLSFAAHRGNRTLLAAGLAFERVIAAGGGARSHLWLTIKAGIYNRPVYPLHNLESGLLGGAALGGLSIGLYADTAAAVARLVRWQPPVRPDPALADYYARLGEIFDALYASNVELCSRLEELERMTGQGPDR